METRPLVRVLDTARTVTPLGAAAGASFEVPEDEARETLRGQVTARLADGTYRVVVADRTLELALPGRVKPGDTLQLSLPAGVKPGDVVHLRVVGKQGEHAARFVPNPAPTGKGLSSAGQLIGALLGEEAGPPLRQTQPVLNVPPATPGELPEPLARAVERSGVFYESHQARWVNGEFPLERLLQEPQAVLTRTASLPAENEPADAGSPLAAARTTLDAAAQRTVSASDQAAETPRTEVAARETLPLIRQQLDALDSRQITWLGEVWPGQTMRWEIAEDDPSRHDEQDEPNDWRTRFALDLPALGEVGAELGLSGEGVRITLSARNAEVARVMQAAAAELVQALEKAGITTTGLKVRCGEPSV